MLATTPVSAVINLKPAQIIFICFLCFIFAFNFLYGTTHPPMNLVVDDVTNIGDRSISTDIYDNLVFYFKYATSAYSYICPRPNGNTMVLQFSNTATDIQGFVARDNIRKEIVVSLRGSASLIDILMDASIALVPFISLGLSPPEGTLVHAGFLVAWTSVEAQILAVVAAELALYPNFSIITTGHSMGGAIASLAAITLKQNHPKREVRMYTYGQPRTGNAHYAKFVNDEFGSKAFRVVHADDGVPTIIPNSLGYAHHGIEYWQYADPPSAIHTVQCAADGEDQNCSASIPSQGITPAHLAYFGIIATTPFCI